MLLHIVFFHILLVSPALALGNKVIELTDRFADIRHDGVWLVKFYAPWCGHCKNLEPIWSQVAQSLVDTDIRVARLDCTRYTSLASEFQVHGFPTVLYIKGHKTVEYKGERKREEIVDFAKRIDGPSVRYLSKCEDIPIQPHRVYFVLYECANVDPNEILKNEYLRVAQDFHAYLYFYTAPCSCMPHSSSLGTLFVYKDGTSFIFTANNTKPLNESLTEWVNIERFPAFLKITYGNFPQLMRTGKKIVMAVLEENVIGGLTMKMTEFKEVVEAIAQTTRERYHEHFLFGYVAQPTLAHSLAMMALPIPSLLVVNSQTYQYHLPESEDSNAPPTPQAIIELLDRILENTAPAFGGTGLFYRFYGGFFELKTSLQTMWKGNPVLTVVLLGMPLGILSIIVYTSCCNGILDADEEEDLPDEAPERRHEKKE